MNVVSDDSSEHDPSPATEPSQDTEPRQSTAPQDVARSRDLQGRGHQPWVRRGLLVLMAAFVAVALAGRLGPPEKVSAVTDHPAARIDLRAPTVLRAGLLWRARVTVRAHRRIVDPELILGAGYISGMQLNSLEPAPTDEASRGDSLALTYPTLNAGEQLTVYLQLQVNPATLGRQDLSVALDGDGVGPAPVRRSASVTVLP